MMVLEKYSKKIKINLENAKMVEQGKYQNLLCTECGEASASVFFTKKVDAEKYGIWFECQLCGNVEHIDCNSQPTGFRIDLIDQRFQRWDERAWKAECNPTLEF